MRGLSLSLLAGLAFMLPGAVTAGDTELHWTLAADLQQFNYREFDLDDRELNHEFGPLAGVRASLNADGERLFARIDASAHDGTVTYDGETQAGRPVISETQTLLRTVSAEPGYWINPEVRQWGLFLRLAHHRWERDIQPTGNVQGIFEVYRWKEIGAGVRHVWRRPQDQRWGHQISAAGFGVLNGDVLVELSALQGSNLRDTRLRLGDNAGARLRYTATRELDNGLALRIEPSAAVWGFGRSNTELAGGDLAVTEPRSQSWRLGLSLGLRF